MYDDLQEMIRQSPSASFGNIENGVSVTWIRKAEAFLGFSLPPSYTWWLRNYGGGEVGGEEIYSIYEMDFDQAVGGDIVFNAIANMRSNGCGFDRLYICRTGVDEYFFFETKSRTDVNEFPVFIGDHRSQQTEHYAKNFAEFLMKRIRFFDH
ncbi:MAG: SMI1/KNR4 family protein [Acidobacteria bacterium]|nr:SMI1/KNR4 family protein [Acidobacteriota bacterium]